MPLFPKFLAEADGAYPRRCTTCAKTAVVLGELNEYPLDMAKGGVLHRLSLDKFRTPTCGHCGEIYLTETSNGQLLTALAAHCAEPCGCDA